MQQKLGIVGGGQLGQMLTKAAKKLGFHVSVLDPTPQCPASQVADQVVVGDFKDPDAIRNLGSQVDFLTFEIELAHAGILDQLAQEGVRVNPSARILTLIQDKFAQKVFLRDRGIPVADFMLVEDEGDIQNVVREFGYPFLLKARFDSYDGRGNALVEKEEDIALALEKLKGRKLYAEKFFPFAKELAVMVGRDMHGKTITYPVVETQHKNNICHIVLAPAPIPSNVARYAQHCAIGVINHLHGIGIFGVEMFLNENGDILINEIAPRVHNSGHYTIEACDASQFKQQILAITGQKLEEPTMRVPAAAMVNILGERLGQAQPEGISEAEAMSDVGVHMYGKLETRPDRKMGHITATAQTIEEALEKAMIARNLIKI